jgi:hypothetical protein
LIIVRATEAVLDQLCNIDLSPVDENVADQWCDTNQVPELDPDCVGNESFSKDSKVHMTVEIDETADLGGSLIFHLP